MAKKEKKADKKHYVKDVKIKGFGMETPNKPDKPKEPTPNPKDDKK